MTASVPSSAKTDLFSSMRVEQVRVIDRAAAALSSQMDELEDAGLMADASTVRVAVDGLYRTRAKLVQLLRRDGIEAPPVPRDTVQESEAIDGRCPGCDAVRGQAHKQECTL